MLILEAAQDVQDLAGFLDYGLIFSFLREKTQGCKILLTESTTDRPERKVRPFDFRFRPVHASYAIRHTLSSAGSLFSLSTEGKYVQR